jgi:hypothetical protein
MSRLPGPITVTVTCRTSRDSAKGSKRHPVTLNPDGTADTGHDLEQERVLAALGGYLSCLELADRASPAVLEWFVLEQRLAPRPIRAKQARGPWHAAKKAHCCAKRGYKTPQAAASHARDPKHVALTHSAHAYQVEALCRGIAAEPVPEMPGEPWTSMWDCGMHPDEVDRISMEIDADEPLPVQFYLGVMARNPRLAWIRDTMRAVPLEPRSITYLAWSYGKADRADPALRARWLRTGIMDRLALRLMGSPYDIADVEAFAAHWAISPVMAGVELMKWCDSGVAPSVAALAAPGLEHLAYPPTPPRWQTRARLRDELDGKGQYTEEELALALVKWGSVKAAAEGLFRSRCRRAVRTSSGT